MTNPVQDASAALESALSAIEGVRFYRLGTTTSGVSVVLSPPKLTWETYSTVPTTATFLVHLVVPFDDRAVEKLWEFVVPVSEAIESVVDAVVLSADPGLYPDGSTSLPEYVFTVEYSLS